MFASGKTAAVASAANYIEDVFSTYLYTGNGSTQTITNGINLSTKGGLVWMKKRSAANDHFLEDSARSWDSGGTLSTNTTAAQTNSGGYFSVSTTGFSLPTAVFNDNTATYASWTFRKQPKFFDVVTYTGNGQSTARGISHNLGSRPGCIIVKRTDSTGDWWVAFDADGGGTYLTKLKLNSTQASTGSTGLVHSSTSFTCNLIDDPSSYDVSVTNTNGASYVAYLFAHNAGGFGLTGTDNVISCGSFTTASGSGIVDVTLGYEPQWVLFKTTGTADDWVIMDNMRGFPVAGSANALRPNASNAESGFGTGNYPTATGFHLELASAQPYIYIAIRRGPMKVPTSGTSVFSPQTYAGNGTSPRNLTSGFTTDLVIGGGLSGSGANIVEDRLRGNAYSQTFDIAAETTGASASSFATNNGYILLNTGGSGWNATGTNYDRWMFRRAPSFFDELCFTGNGVGGRAITHNLTTTPEMIICKSRSDASYWLTYHVALGNTQAVSLNAVDATQGATNYWYNTSPTSTQFTVGVLNNESAKTYVAYLFSTTAGVSKVGSYTGTGTLQTVNCGFTGGARFVLIKRTDDIGDWYVYDSAAGISSGNDPYMRLNSGGAQVTGTNYVDTDSTGFKVTAAAPAGLNASGGTYIFLAVA